MNSGIPELNNYILVIQTGIALRLSVRGCTELGLSAVIRGSLQVSA